MPSIALVKSIASSSMTARGFERRISHDAVHTAALHAEVPGVVERQHSRFAQVAVELVLAVDGVDPLLLVYPATRPAERAPINQYRGPLWPGQ